MRWNRIGTVLAAAALVTTIGVAPVAFAEPGNVGESSVTAPLNTPFSAEGITYTITSTSLTPDVDDSVRLDLGITAAVGDGYGVNFWDRSFRLTSGTESYAPVSGLSEVVQANSTADGTVSFVVPDTVTAATLVISFPESEQDVPITLDADAIAQTGAPGGDGVTVPLNTPFSSDAVTYTIISAVAAPDPDSPDSTRLDLEIKAAVGDNSAGLNFWDRSFRLQAAEESYAPVSGLNEVLAANSTKTGTVSFVVPDSTSSATLVITFLGGDKSVPITFGGEGLR